MLAIDLFAGCGGGSLGLEQVGIEVAIAIDDNPINTETYNHNFGGNGVCADLTKVNANHIKTWANLDKCDIVLGGPPCQGFSSEGKRRGDDKRNSLVLSFAVLATSLAPKWIILENVQGMARSPLFGCYREIVEGEGYATEYKVLKVSDYGVPQARKRVIAVSTRRGVPAPIFPPPTQPIVTVRDAIADLPNPAHFPELLEKNELSSLWFNSPTSDYARLMSRDRPETITGFKRTQHDSLTMLRFSELKPGERDPISRARRLDWDGFAPTLTAGGDKHSNFSANFPIHPNGQRRIVVREAARLQSFPDWFDFDERTIWARRQIGNSMPPLLIAAIAKQILLCAQG